MLEFWYYFKLQSFSKRSICVLQQNLLHQNDRLIVVQLMISVLQINLYSVELRQFSIFYRFAKKYTWTKLNLWNVAYVARFPLRETFGMIFKQCVSSAALERGP